MSMSPKVDPLQVGRWVTQVVPTPEAHAILGPMIPDRTNSWTRGGCCVLAMALQAYLGRGKLMALVREGEVVHVVLALGNRYIDAGGAHTKGELEDEWTRTFGPPAILGPFDAAWADRSGVRCPNPAPFVQYLERAWPRVRFSQSGTLQYDVGMASRNYRGQIGGFNPTQRMAIGSRGTRRPIAGVSGEELALRDPASFRTAIYFRRFARSARATSRANAGLTPYLPKGNRDCLSQCSWDCLDKAYGEVQAQLGQIPSSKTHIRRVYRLASKCVDAAARD